MEGSDISFESEVDQHEKEIKHILQFPFGDYFVNEIDSARIDLLTSWILRYPYNQFSRIMLPYPLEFKNADSYIKRYNQRKKKQLEPPSDLPNDVKFHELQRELGKLPLATRLHLLDVFEYSSFGKKSKQKPLSEMTLYDTRAVGIDENESANILHQSKLIASFPDGTGFISPEYADATSMAIDYAKKIAPIYDEWKREVSEVMDKQLFEAEYGDVLEDDDFNEQ
jgi:hypothetical protein